MNTHQVSLSHWGIFWCKVTAQMKVSLRGYDMYGLPAEEGIISEIFHYEPLKYSDEIDKIVRKSFLKIKHGIQQDLQ